ncbi:MAG: 2-oxoacid:acceptor oxidoreductase family protein [Candidatus Cloacimonadales bacterium]
MKNIYLIGVGGQGIGLLSEVLIRAADYAGYNVLGVDTHGLAQRGGTVESFIRLGEDIHSPLFFAAEADLVIALEKHEAIRGMQKYSKQGSSLVYYEAEWQPLAVRQNKAKAVSKQDIAEQAAQQKIDLHPVYLADLSEAKQQNMVILAYLAQKQIIPKLSIEHYLQAIKDLMAGDKLQKNLQLFKSLL